MNSLSAGSFSLSRKINSCASTGAGGVFVMALSVSLRLVEMRVTFGLGLAVVVAYGGRVSIN